MIKRVLIVDDNHDVADSLAQWLIVAGHHVSTVYCGEAALASMRTIEPDIVLLDIGLPDLNGYDVAGKLRLIKDIPPFVLVAVTGYGQSSDNVFKDMGFDHYFAKPMGERNLKSIGLSI